MGAFLGTALGPAAAVVAGCITYFADTLMEACACCLLGMMLTLAGLVA
jgi:hypothetical protein